MVEVLVRYSNIARESDPVELPTIDRASERRTEHPSRPARHRSAAVKLGAPGIATIVAEYVAGASASELAAKYDISKPTVLKLLNEHGVTRRRRLFCADKQAMAAELYASGLSLEAVGEELGFSAKTILTALRQAGIERLNSHGRER